MLIVTFADLMWNAIVVFTPPLPLSRAVWFMDCNTAFCGRRDRDPTYLL